MSLTDHCLVEIVLHLEDYSIEELSVLPRSLRQDLLTRLPIPDLCKFEGTSVTDGVDMEEVWYTKCLLDVNVHPAKNVQEKSPARCAEYGAWQSWVSGCMSVMLPTDSNKKPWREYYFSARFGRILGSLNFETLRELEQALYYIPQRHEHARFLIEFAKKYIINDCCCDNERVIFLSQGFVIPPRYQLEKYKRTTLATLREDLILLFMQLTSEYPREMDVPMIPGKHNMFMLGPERNLALSSLQTLEYDIEMECRLDNKEDDFAKHLEIISSVQHSKPILHMLEIKSVSGASHKRGSYFQDRKPAVIETGTLTKATSTPAYLNLQWLRIGGGVIEPYIAFLLPLIAKQPNLHSLEILYDISKERLALSAHSLELIHDFFKRPHFQRLGLAGFKLPAEFFCSVFQEFLSNSAEQKTTLYVCEIEITDTTLTKSFDPPTNGISSECSLPLSLKSLSLKYLHTSLSTLWSEHILPTISNIALNLEVFDVSNCNIGNPTNLLSVLTYHPNLVLDVVNISGIVLPDEETCCKVLEDFFKNHPSLQEFHANKCGLGKSLLLTSLAKTFSTNSSRMGVKVLALTKNDISSCSKETLVSFFAAICSLPQLSDVGLSCNGLLPEHAELFRNAWKKSGHSKFYVLGWRFAPAPRGYQSWPPRLEPQDRKANRAALRDTCWNLLL